MTHHPHVHMIVPGGGISLDGTRWISAEQDYLLPVTVLSSLFRGKMLALLKAAHADGKLQFFGKLAGLTDKAAFKAYLEPLYTTNWYVHAKRPFAGPAQVLAYLARYTHRVAISNSRLIRAGTNGVTFRVKDYRLKRADRYKTMTLAVPEFIRRFMLHVLPKGFHRIRHYGLFAGGPAKAATIERARELIAAAAPAEQAPIIDEPPADAKPASPDKPEHPCPCCGARMVIIEVFDGVCPPPPRSKGHVEIRIDTS